MVFCPNCGAENPDNGTFCSSCGTRIDAYRQPSANDGEADAGPKRNNRLVCAAVVVVAIIVVAVAVVLLNDSDDDTPSAEDLIIADGTYRYQYVMSLDGEVLGGSLYNNHLRQ